MLQRPLPDGGAEQVAYAAGESFVSVSPDGRFVAVARGGAVRGLPSEERDALLWAWQTSSSRKIARAPDVYQEQMIIDADAGWGSLTLPQAGHELPKACWTRGGAR